MLSVPHSLLVDVTIRFFQGHLYFNFLWRGIYAKGHLSLTCIATIYSSQLQVPLKSRQHDHRHAKPLNNSVRPVTLVLLTFDSGRWMLTCISCCVRDFWSRSLCVSKSNLLHTSFHKIIIWNQHKCRFNFMILQTNLAIGSTNFVGIMNQVHNIDNQCSFNFQPISLHVVINFMIWYPYSHNQFYEWYNFMIQKTTHHVSYSPNRSTRLALPKFRPCLSELWDTITKKQKKNRRQG